MRGADSSCSRSILVRYASYDGGTQAEQDGKESRIQIVRELTSRAGAALPNRLPGGSLPSFHDHLRPDAALPWIVETSSTVEEKCCNSNESRE